MTEQLRPDDPRRAGPYRLTGRLGGGGMGEVFLGRSAGGRPVAVKVIRADLASDDEFRTRFRREVAAARRVNGLYTATVADADTEGTVPWLATAYLPGPRASSSPTRPPPPSTSSGWTTRAGNRPTCTSPSSRARGKIRGGVGDAWQLDGPQGCIGEFITAAAARVTVEKA